MQNKQHVIDELNRFLRGRYMGIHQYEQLIRHANDPQLQQLLQTFQAHAKMGTQQVAERIEQLGGKPADGVGVMGEIREWMQKLKGYPERSEDILHDALVGENKYGIHFSHRMVAGELDEESAKLIDTILEEDQKRADQLQRLLEKEQAPAFQ